jgi:hypothetical protein
VTGSALPLSALGLPPGSRLAATLRARLAEVEEILVTAATSAPPVVERDRPPFAVEGVRPHATLALLGARLSGAACGAAVVVELTYLATRCHEAVRDRPAGSAVAGRQHNVDAVLAGDLLIVRATGLAADLPRPALRRWADALGAVHEAKLAGRIDAAARALREAAFEIGALTGGAADAQLPAPVAAARAIVERHLAAGLTTSAAPAGPAGR